MRWLAALMTKQVIPAGMDAREYYLRWLAALMTKRIVPSKEMEDYLKAGEYALALLELAAEVDDSIKGRVP